jgi:hypothetical protein
MQRQADAREAEARRRAEEFKKKYPDVPGAAPFDPNANWCTNVPDFNVDVKYCCYLHDACYGKGGNEANKQVCDILFNLCLQRTDSWIAPIYWAGVVCFGDWFFNWDEESRARHRREYEEWLETLRASTRTM